MLQETDLPLLLNRKKNNRLVVVPGKENYRFLFRVLRIVLNTHLVTMLSMEALKVIPRPLEMKGLSIIIVIKKILVKSMKIGIFPALSTVMVFWRVQLETQRLL